MMWDLEAEMEQFQTRREVDEVEEEIYKHGLTDITDLLVEMEKERKTQKAEGNRGTEG